MSEVKTPKVFKKGYGSNFVIPFAIVLIGSLIIFGVTKMLQTDRGYKDLVRELHSKTFGNRWIAAFELSKVISANGVPEEEVPWLVENLAQLYESAVDSRTRNFIVVTLGALKSPLGLPIIEKSLDEKDPQTKFHALVALSQSNLPIAYDWKKVRQFLDSDDEGLQQAAILTLATHRDEPSQEKISTFLMSDNRNLRFASATGLIYFKDSRALKTLGDILVLSPKTTNEVNALGENKIFGLKLNIINGLKKTRWKELAIIVSKNMQNEKNLKLVSLTREVLEELKN